MAEIAAQHVISVLDGNAADARSLARLAELLGMNLAHEPGKQKRPGGDEHEDCLQSPRGTGAIGADVWAHAQQYPDKAIRMIVPFPPGGGTDVVARVVAAKLSETTGWTVGPENGRQRRQRRPRPSRQGLALRGIRSCWRRTPTWSSTQSSGKANYDPIAGGFHPDRADRVGAAGDGRRLGFADQVGQGSPEDRKRITQRHQFRDARCCKRGR